MDNEKTITLTESEINKVLEYLGNRPFKEVYQLIDMLQMAWNIQHPTVGQE